MADFKRHKSDAAIRLDETFFPVNKLVDLELMLTAVCALRQTTGLPTLNVLLPKGALLLKFL
jgi:hypothetical protein